VADWSEEARAEADKLKPYYLKKHRWSPRLVGHGDDEVLDLLVSMTGRRLPGKRYLLRLRYQPDWRQAGRREAFVDPDHPDVAGPEFWPPEGGGINPKYRHPNGQVIPAICLRGVFGYHSVLHPDRAMDNGPGSLLTLLVELQRVLDG
jgi:hypothetical protein